jgi:hypothetical protein
VPPQLEERTHRRRGYRVDAELVRYHQIGVARGWIELDGERHEIVPETGCRRATTPGACATTWARTAPTRAHARTPPGFGFMMIWCPVLLERRRLALRPAPALHLDPRQRLRAAPPRPASSTRRSRRADPRHRAGAALRPRQPAAAGRAVHCTMADGRAAGIDDRGAGRHGRAARVRGSTSGSTATTTASGAGRCTSRASTSRLPPPENARELHQIRDTAVRVTDPVAAGGGVGWGNCQPIAVGAPPR